MKVHHGISSKESKLNQKNSANDSSYNIEDSFMFTDGYREGIKNIVKKYHHVNIENLPANLIKEAKKAYLHYWLCDADYCDGEFVDEANIGVMELLSYVIGGNISKEEMADKIIYRAKKHIMSSLDRDIDEAYCDMYGDDVYNDYAMDHSVSDFI